MSDSDLSLKWIDKKREPQCDPDPAHPNGVDVDLRDDPDKPSCRTALPYPAKRCGLYVVACKRCGLTVGITTAGRADDPRSVRVPCKTH